MENDITKLQNVVSQKSDYIDLIDTNFVSYRPGNINQKLSSFLNSYFTKNHYHPDSKGLLCARKAIALYYANRKLKISADKLLLTASSSESYSLIFNTLKDADSEVLLPNPTYPLFEHLSSFSSLKSVYYQLDRHNHWQPDIKDIESKITKNTKFIVFISPNNPTGSVIELRIYQQLMNLAVENKLTVICDEVFSEFYYNSRPQMPDINQFKTNIFILNGISKILAAADLKLAWLGFNNYVATDIIEKLELVNDCYLNANYFSQEALPMILPLVNEVRGAIMPMLEENKAVLSHLCQQNSLYFSCNMPEGGIHAMLHLNSTLDEDTLVCELLKQKSVNTHPGYFYDYDCTEPSLIISLLQNPEKFAKGLFKIKEFVIQ